MIYPTNLPQVLLWILNLVLMFWYLMYFLISYPVRLFNYGVWRWAGYKSDDIWSLAWGWCGGEPDYWFQCVGWKYVLE